MVRLALPVGFVFAGADGSVCVAEATFCDAERDQDGNFVFAGVRRTAYGPGAGQAFVYAVPSNDMDRNYVPGVLQVVSFK